MKKVILILFCGILMGGSALAEDLPTMKMKQKVHFWGKLSLKPTLPSGFQYYLTKTFKFNVEEVGVLQIETSKNEVKCETGRILGPTYTIRPNWKIPTGKEKEFTQKAIVQWGSNPVEVTTFPTLYYPDSYTLQVEYFSNRADCGLEDLEFELNFTPKKP